MDENLAKLTELCRRFGAPEGQARTMAAQMLKRADQLAAEHGTTQVEALNHLLQVLIKGREGEVAPEFPPRKG